MRKTLHLLFFASFIEKYYFSLCGFFLITMEVESLFASFYILAKEVVQIFIVSHVKLLEAL